MVPGHGPAVMDRLAARSSLFSLDALASFFSITDGSLVSVTPFELPCPADPAITICKYNDT